MLLVCWRKKVDINNINEEVFRPFPVICDYIAGFSFVIESATMLVTGFEAGIVEGRALPPLL